VDLGGEYLEGDARVQTRRKGAVLAHLRAVTRPAHHALEGALGLLEEDIDLDKYKNVLARFYGFWSGWEPQGIPPLAAALF
jgi:hypothetical protein